MSFLQGHEAFNALFFGQSLPRQLSLSALTFVLIATPLLSLIAGLVPEAAVIEYLLQALILLIMV